MDYYQPPVTVARNAEKVDVSGVVPPDALSIKLRVTITPASGALAVYTPKTPDQPIRFSGPVAEGNVPLSGPFISIQPVEGTATWNIEALGWQDSLNAR